jgi:hypothetical protein
MRSARFSSRSGQGLKADGPEFTYYASAARLSTVRLTTLRPGRCVPRPGRSGVRQISTRDVSTAFLQSDPFPDTDRRYLKVVNPIDGSIEYWRQLRPLYGEGSAPARWAKTLFLHPPGVSESLLVVSVAIRGTVLRGWWL